MSVTDPIADMLTVLRNAIRAKKRWAVLPASNMKKSLLDVLAKEKRPLSEIVAPLRRYHQSGEINSRVGDPKLVIDRIAEEHTGAPVVSHLDGLLVRYADWWFNLRPSNTEPVLRLNLEADTREKMECERDAMLARIAELG